MIIVDGKNMLEDIDRVVFGGRSKYLNYSIDREIFSSSEKSRCKMSDWRHANSYQHLHAILN